jgi:leucyl-tRNA synthetase
MVIKDGAKMSKSKGNVVDPDDLIHTFGADTARLFSLFAAPPEKDLDWNDHGVEGASRFLNRIWRFVLTHLDELKAAGRASAPATEAGRAFRRTVHETIKRVTDDIERDFHFNTAISAVMELVNAIYAFESVAAEPTARAERASLLREAVETALLLLGPVAPHVTEELWAQLGHEVSLFEQRWPTPDAAALVRKELTLVVQVDGKVRSRLVVDVDMPEATVKRLALEDDKVQAWVRQRAVDRVVVVANRLVNIVTRA